MILKLLGVISTGGEYELDVNVNFPLIDLGIINQPTLQLQMAYIIPKFHSHIVT